MSKLNVTVEIRRAGMERFRKPGSIYLPQLQVTHILKCLGHPHYTDNAGVRLRRHALLYGPTGAVKTTCIKRFLLDYAGSCDVAVPNDAAVRGLVPTHLDFGGQGMSWERIRGGSTSEGKFIPPLLREADYYVSGELFSFLGRNPARQGDRVEVLNEILEEGRVTVALNKMFHMSDKAKAALEETLESERGVHFNAYHAMLAYDVEGVFLSASRFFTSKEKEMITDSGLWSRLNPTEWRPSDAEDATYRRKQFGKEDTGLTARILDWNIRAWQTEFTEVPYPPEEMVDALMGHYHETYDRVRAETGLRIEEIGNTRDTTDAAQLLTAHAAMRTMNEKDWLKKGPVPTIHYIDEDLEWAVAFSQPRLNTLYDTLLGTNETDPKLDEARNTLVSYVAQRDGDYPDILEGTPFTEFYAKEQRCSIQTARRRLKTLKERGLVTPSGRLGQYTVASDIMAEAGHILTIAPAHEEMD